MAEAAVPQVEPAATAPPVSTAAAAAWQRAMSPETARQVAFSALSAEIDLDGDDEPGDECLWLADVLAEDALAALA